VPSSGRIVGNAPTANVFAPMVTHTSASSRRDECGLRRPGS
jgi:hypothetical protein